MFECRKTIYSLLMQLHKHFQNGFGIVIEGQSIISLEDSDSEIVEAIMNGTKLGPPNSRQKSASSWTAVKVLIIMFP